FHTPVLGAAAAIIRRPFKLHGYNARNPLLRGGGQALHRDIDTGPQLEGRTTNGSSDLINALWMLDDFTESNGPTRVVPGSHLHSRDIHQEMVDPMLRHPEEELLIAPAGTIVIINGALWHSGTVNISGEPRRALHISFVERHFPQQVEQRTHIEKGTPQALASVERFLLDVEKCEWAGHQ
ncbi:MAG: phytanoyl-CoA dioxygenase family protein, partial [Nitrososphaerales archaeon]